MSALTVGKKSCTSCQLYLTCSRPEKQYGYACEIYRGFSIKDSMPHSSRTAKNITGQSHVDMAHEEIDPLDPMSILLSAQSSRYAREELEDQVTGRRSSEGEAARSFGDVEFDISEVISKAASTTGLVPHDLKLDDSSMPHAANFYEFCIGEDFLNVKPYLMQILVATTVFADYCPRCSDVEWMMHDRKVDDNYVKLESKVCFLRYGVCPSCKVGRSALVLKGELSYYNEMAVVAGQRGGKSALTAMMFAYLTHRIIKLQNPNQVYGLLPNSVLHMTQVALTFAQAKDTVWTPTYEYLASAPWFVKYHEMMDFYAQKYGEEFEKLRDTFYYIKSRSLLIYASSPDKRTLRGRTRAAALIDELSWFNFNAQEKRVKTDADGVYIALERSLLTIRSAASRLLRQGFNDIPSGYFLNISSPANQMDKMMSLLKKSQHSKKLYGLQIPTWEMNPTITMEDLHEEFMRDPITAQRDYGAEPPLSTNAFLASHDIVEGCFRTSQNGIRLIYRQGKRKDQTLYRYAEADWVKGCVWPSILSLDAGFSGASFGLVCAHKIENDIIVDIVAEVMPLPGVPLNHTRIFEELIHPIIDRQNVVYVCADRWNSIKLLSDVEAEYGILTKQYSLKYRDFFNFRVMMEQQQVHWPKPSMPLADIVNTGPGDYPAKFLTRPSDHLALQCLTVQDTGTKVVKGDGDLNDDIWRALVLAATLISLPELEQVFSRKRLDEQKDRMLGTMRSGQRDRVGQANATSQRYGTMGKALGVSIGRRDPS